jgi:RsiW-degrading membrane proteinase PrsW (M82 family)
MVLFGLAIAPGIAISLYFFLKDQYNREPRHHLVISFFLGMLAALMAVGLQLLLTPVQASLPANNLAGIALKAFLLVGLTEEWCKYLMVRYYAYRQPEFDEPFDGIVYAVMVAMGFATLENVAYVMQNGLATAIARMFLSVPAHACFAVLMGYHLGRARFDAPHRFLHLMRGLFLAACFHGCYDFFLFLRDNSLVKQYLSDFILFGGAIISFLIALTLSRIAVREHVAMSRDMHGPKEV